jgi:hypothetical protein
MGGLAALFRLAKKKMLAGTTPQSRPSARA